MFVTRPATIEENIAKTLYLKLAWSSNLGSLTWGDGYVDKMVEYRQVGNLSAVPTVSKNQIVPSSCYNKGYPFCPIEAALLRMSSHLYPLGEG